MTLKPLALGALVLGLSATASADIVGVSAGVYGWNPDFSGRVTSGSTSVDLEDDLKLGNEWATQGYVALEHPIPLLPNVKLQFTELSQDATGRIDTPFDGVNGAVDVDLDLTHTDLILYYELLDNIVSLDLGLNVKFFDGHLNIHERAGNNSSRTDIDEILPLLYVAPSVSLPLTGLSLGAEVAGVAYSGNRLTDITARLRYEVAIFGVEAGWRQINLEIDDVGDLDTDIRFGGPFVSVMVDF